MKQAFLVDDSKSARIVLSRLLKKNGFDEVEMAESGEQALEQLKNITPDAIFVDFLMDGMDGLETITEIKKDPRFVATPVVMCTANEGDEYVRAAVDHGALGILAKPPTDQSLGEIIDMIEQHQQEVAANDAAQPVSEPVKAEAVEIAPAEAASPAPVVQAGLDEAAVRRIAAEVAGERVEQIATRRAEEVAAEMAARMVGERVESAISAFLDENLEAVVVRLVEQRLAAFKPPEVDLDDLRSQVVQEVNSDLEEFVRQLNQRTVEGLIEASIYEQINEVANDFAQRLADTERRILDQVPEKNEMIEHIRVVTEGSLEAQVRETATQVAQEISNSVATETVETLLDQHLAHQSLAQESHKSPLGWILGLLALTAAGVGAYFYLLL
ncbi:MAG: response regulator [Candidatus Thiodiazotropha sp.]